MCGRPLGQEVDHERVGKGLQVGEVLNWADSAVKYFNCLGHLKAAWVCHPLEANMLQECMHFLHGIL